MSALAARLRELERIVGDRHLLTATEEVGQHTVDGQTPLAVAFPGSAEEVAALLQLASEAKLSVLLRGAGHHSYLGAPPQPIGLVLSLARLDGVVEYEPEDVTITVQAGMTMGALQRLLAQHGQMLALDPPGPEGATLGGIVSANLAGPMRMRYGWPRDLVIGLRAVLANGEVIKAGGRTVKNVAGYSLSRLFVGSLGSLGAILEVTTRLTPLPERQATIGMALPSAEAARVAAWLVSSPLEVMACQVLTQVAAERVGGPAAGPDGQVLLVRLAGEAEGIARQEREIRSRVRECARLEGEQAEQVWRQVRQLIYPAPGAILLRAAVPISRVGEMLAKVSSPAAWLAVAGAGDGIIYAAPPAAEPTMETRAKLAALRGAAEELSGFAVLEAGPPALKREFPVWGRMANADLMWALKQAYDPAAILGCGRLIGAR